uniref:Ankyrin repeat domain-containing protein 39 n=1 Tax=Anas platyrhynchos TaxID=8839 RepID=A0A8B9ZAU9_ANAPL
MAAGRRRSPPGPCCPPGAAVPGVRQSLAEMDFERGIWAAARDGDEARVLQLLERRGEPSETDTAGYTALHYASRNGHLGVCRLLLQRGARCDARTPGGATALHRACYCGHLPVVRLLLEHGADPSAADGDGRTGLHKVGGGDGTPARSAARGDTRGDAGVARRRPSVATGTSAPCSCSSTPRWRPPATPGDGGPATRRTPRSGTCWMAEGGAVRPVWIWGGGHPQGSVPAGKKEQNQVPAPKPGSASLSPAHGVDVVVVAHGERRGQGVRAGGWRCPHTGTARPGLRLGDLGGDTAPSQSTPRGPAGRYGMGRGGHLLLSSFGTGACPCRCPSGDLLSPPKPKHWDKKTTTTKKKNKKNSFCVPLPAQLALGRIRPWVPTRCSQGATRSCRSCGCSSGWRESQDS